MGKHTRCCVWEHSARSSPVHCYLRLSWSRAPVWLVFVTAKRSLTSYKILNPDWKVAAGIFVFGPFLLNFFACSGG